MILTMLFGGVLLLPIWKMRPYYCLGILQFYERGEPFVMHRYREDFSDVVSWNQQKYACIIDPKLEYKGPIENGLRGEWNVKGVLLDLLSALLLIGCFAFWLEYVARKFFSREDS